MLRSLSSGVSGLKSHQTAMDVTGNNISNVNTYGFKSARTTFRDVYYQTLAASSNASGTRGGSNGSQVGYGTSVASVDVQNTRTGFTSTGKSMDCYIDGEGYFVIKDGAGNEHLTQVGTFGFDGQGNLVDGTGNFVCGYTPDYDFARVLVGGADISFSQKDASNLNGYTIDIQYAKTANPNKTPATTTISPDLGTKTITVLYTPTINDDGTTSFLTKKDLDTAFNTASNWVQTNWHNNGKSLAPTDKFPTVTAGAVNGTNAITIADAADTTTKINATSGMVAMDAHYDASKAQSPQKIRNTFGELKNCAVSADGTITGEDTNGTIQIIGKLALANVPNPDALTFEGNSFYKAVNNTGTVTYHAPGSDNMGALQTGGLESSNVDLAEEFANMIMEERGFQACSKMITVSDEMLETLVNLKR
ncbi:MAG TPA: flagellar hook-basal body complex protein [Caproiciproducens sp.]|nr:flagellar hook-basal body complex protein [Caproiciproducens sp.]